MLFHVSEIHTVKKKLLIKAQYPALFNVRELMESILKNLSKHSLQDYREHHKFCPLAAFIIMLRENKKESEIQFKRPLQVTCKVFVCKLWPMQLKGSTVVHF